MKDKLEQIFELQEKLMYKYVDLGFLPEFPLDLRKKENVKCFRECVFHLMQELFETVYHLKNRPNRLSEIPDYNREEFEEELIDALHLFVEACILSGMTPDHIMERYEAKNKINHDRVNKKY